MAIQLMVGPWVQTSVYDIPLIDFEHRAVLTNTAPTGPYRDPSMDEGTPCTNNPLGTKGVGELGTIGATPSIVNAAAWRSGRRGCRCR